MSVSESSPDPLANSLSSGPTTVRSTRSYQRGTPPRRQTRSGKQILSKDFVVNTPPSARHANSVLSTKPQGGDNVSPWRIRVTVEAQREGEDEDGRYVTEGAETSVAEGTRSTPAGRNTRATRTTTTTKIPLKGFESPPALSTAGKGRPRKLGTPAKRTGTRGLRNTQPRRVARKTNRDDVVPGPSNEVESTPRSGRSPTSRTGMTAAIQEYTCESSSQSLWAEQAHELATNSEVANKQRRSRRKEMSPIKIAVDPDAEYDDSVDWLEAASAADKIQESQQKKGNGKVVLSDIKLNQASINSNNSEAIMMMDLRSGLGDDDEQVENEVSKFSPAKKTPIKSSLAGSGAYKQQSASSSRIGDVTAQSRMPPPAITRSLNAGGNSSRPTSKQVSFMSPDKEHSMLTPDPQATFRVSQYRDFDSVLESEGFSMISTATLPSVKEALSSPPAQLEEDCRSKSSDSGQLAHAQAANPSSSVPDTDQNDEVDMIQLPTRRTSPRKHASSQLPETSVLSNVRSSPPTRTLEYSFDVSRQETPATFSSPSLPPPVDASKPRYPALAAQASSNPACLSPAVRAGTALQGALTNSLNGPSSRLRSPFSSPAKTMKSHPLVSENDHPDPFSAYSQRTRYELGVGLRLGEELARKQIIGSAEKEEREKSLARAEDDVFSDDGKGDSIYPRLPTPESQDDYALNLPGGSPIQYPSLSRHTGIQRQRSSPDKTNDEADAMDWRHPTPVGTPQVLIGEKSSRRLSDELGEAIDDDLAAPDADNTFFSTLEDRELRWEREREEVAREIENASPGRVIVIDSSSIADYSDDASVTDDVEAEYTAAGVQRTPEPSSEEQSPMPQFTVQDTVDDTLGLAAPMARPARGKIPSPWRTNTRESILYSDEAELDRSIVQPAAEPRSSTSSNGLPEGLIPKRPFALPDTHLRPEQRAIIPFRKPVDIAPVPYPSDAATGVETSVLGWFANRVTSVFAVPAPSALGESHTSDTVPSLTPEASTSPASDTIPAFPTRAAFDAHFPAPPAPIAKLPTTKWDVPHWSALQILYEHYKRHPIPYPDNIEAHPLIGMQLLSADGQWMRIVTKKEVSMAVDFRERCLQQRRVQRSPGKSGRAKERSREDIEKFGKMNEKYVLRKLFALVVRDMRRGQGEVLPLEELEGLKLADVEEWQEGNTGVEGVETDGSICQGL